MAISPFIRFSTGRKRIVEKRSCIGGIPLCAKIELSWRENLSRHAREASAAQRLRSGPSSAHNPVTSRGYDRPRGQSSGPRPAPAATSAFRIPMPSHATLDSAD